MITENQKKPQPPEKPVHSLYKALGFALEGIGYTIRTQKNMRIHLVIAVCVISACSFLRLLPLEWALILICIGLVILAELLNTAIEAIIDLVSPQYHLLAKTAKDIGAGMVLIVAFLAVIVGCIVFVTALLRLFG